MLLDYHWEREGFILNHSSEPYCQRTKRSWYIKERIRDYHGSLKYEIGSEDFGTSFYVYDSFINDDEEVLNKGDPNKGGYQGTPDSLEIYEIIDNNDEEREVNYYDQ